MKKNIGGFIIRIIVFAILFVFIDLIIGKAFDAVLFNMPNTQSQTARTNYCIQKANPDCLILGSSRASDHYVSNYIADSLEMSVYNAGRQGYGIAYAYAALLSISERQKPKYVILELDDSELGRTSEPTAILKPYYSKKYIKTIIDSSSTLAERLSQNFHSFRYNGLIFNIVSGLIAPSDHNCGYVSIGNESKINMIDADKIGIEHNDTKVNDQSMNYLSEIIRFCKNNQIKLICFSSPRYYQSDNTFTAKFLKENNVEYHDLSNYDMIKQNPVFFYDLEHLNHKGAVAFSSLVVCELKNII